MSTKYLHLEGIRGVLALSVACSHLLGSTFGWPFPRPLSGAYLAVDAFFVLSGFVLAASLYRTSVSAPTFFLKRLVRLWPTHALVTCLVFGVVFLNGGSNGYVPAEPPLRVDGFLWELALLPRAVWGPWPMMNAPAWSIAVELWVSGLIVYWLVRARADALLVLGLVIYGILPFTTDWAGLAGADVTFIGVPHAIWRGVAGMAIGVAFYHSRGLINQWIEAIPHGIVEFIVLVATLGLAFGVFAADRGKMDLAYLGCSLVLLAVACRSSVPHEVILKIAGTRVGVWLGAISFPLYVVHSPIFLLVRPSVQAERLGAWLSVPLILTSTLIVATILTTGFDTPIRKWLEGRLVPSDDQSKRASDLPRQT